MQRGAVAASEPAETATKLRVPKIRNAMFPTVHSILYPLWPVVKPVLVATDLCMTGARMWTIVLVQMNQPPPAY
jgi:hypothetical protein